LFKDNVNGRGELGHGIISVTWGTEVLRTKSGGGDGQNRAACGRDGDHIVSRGSHAAPTRRRYFRVRWAAAPLLSPFLFAFMVSSGGGSSSAGADSNPTTGSSSAELLQVAPHEGSLAVGAIIGEALAGHANAFARAQSQGVDFGAVGASLKGYNCGSPPTLASLVPDPLQAETGSPGAANGQTQGPNQADYGANEYVLANAAPYGQADTTFAGPVGDPTNAYVLSGLHSKSWSGIVNGVTEAGATSDIGSVSLANGAVVLSGLHWEALYPTGTSALPTGSFSIGNVKVAGVTLPTGLSLSAIAAAVNKALGTLGVQVVLPQASVSQGVESVSPLELQVLPNTTRDSVIDPVLNALQPNYYQIATGLENGFATDKPPLNALGQLEANSAGQQLATALCQSDTPITVLDVALAAFDGGGFFSATLGGVTASSGNLTSNPFSLSTSGLGTASSPGTSTFIPGTLGSSSSSGLSLGGPLSSSAALAPSAAPTTTTTTPATSGASLVPSSRTVSTVTPNGPLLAAGLAGLGLLVLLALGDRRKIRQAQLAVSEDD
jgi:hypothetical protein